MSKDATGGTEIFCPYCLRVTTCTAFSPNEEPEDRRSQDLCDKNIQWFRRGRSCSRCGKEFNTGEIHETLIYQLLEFRASIGRLLNVHLKEKDGRDSDIDDHLSLVDKSLCDTLKKLTDVQKAVAEVRSLVDNWDFTEALAACTWPLVRETLEEQERLI